jgi:hypothetical protein
MSPSFLIVTSVLTDEILPLLTKEMAICSRSDATPNLSRHEGIMPFYFLTAGPRPLSFHFSWLAIEELVGRIKSSPSIISDGSVGPANNPLGVTATDGFLTFYALMVFARQDGRSLGLDRYFSGIFKSNLLLIARKLADVFGHSVVSPPTRAVPRHTRSTHR